MWGIVIVLSSNVHEWNGINFYIYFVCSSNFGFALSLIELLLSTYGVGSEIETLNSLINVEAR